MDVQAKSAIATALLAALGGAVLPAPGQAQLALDWPVRAGVGPEALLAGAAATLWNPAGIAAMEDQAWIVSVDGPEATGLAGVAGAVTLGLPRVGTLGVGFSHMGIDDIPRTLDSPAPQPGDIDVAEDAASVGLSRRLGSWGSVGLGGRWARAGVGGETRARTTGSVGLRVNPESRFRPILALSVVGLGGDERLLVAFSTSLPPSWTGPFRVAMGYGVDGSTRADAVDQRVSLELTWLARFHLGAGFTVTDEGGDGVTPLWTAGADFGRYSLAVLREELWNDFGAVHYYRAAISF